MKQYKLFALAIVITLQCVLIGCTGTGSGASGSAAADSTIAEATMAEQERAEQQRLEQEKAEQERLEQEKAEQERLEQEKAEQQRLEEEKAKQQSLVGTFEITEEGRGNVRTIVLTVNDDETATMRYKDSEFIHYGSWYKYNHMKYAKFHFVEEDNFATSHSTIPHLCFDVVNNRELSNFVLMDGYLYSSSSAAEAKNPKERLKLKRVS